MHRVVVHALEQFEQQIGLLRVGHGIDDMLDGVLGRAARADFNGLRAAHRPLDEGFDLRRDGGGKERGVPVARAAVEDAPHVGQKAHVEHPVGFVEDEESDVVQLAGALLEMIEQAGPAWRR